MDLSPYVASVRTGVTNAAALADDHTRQVAERLGSTLDASTRLALIQALSDAASRISADLAPGSVEVRFADGEPDFVVTAPGPVGEPTLLLPEPTVDPASADEPETEAGPEPEPDTDEPVARVSLRLPTSVKAKVDELADEEGISTNAWLIRAVMDAFKGRTAPEPPAPPTPPTPPRGLGGLGGLGGVFGPDGVFGAHGPFGPNGVFGNDRMGDRIGDEVREHVREQVRAATQSNRNGRRSVQGWVR